MRSIARILALVAFLFIGLGATAGCMQRRLLYFPSHLNVTAEASRSGLTRWKINGEYTGWARVIENPRKVWFFVHGNGGQAGNRAYVLPHLDAADSVYILEYPGYGDRPGSPSKAALDTAAFKGYRWIIEQFGVERVIVLGESLGSGPACALASASIPPKHIVLVVPFDVLVDVAKEKFPFLPVNLIMLDRWNNVAALKRYTGRLEIFGATHDQVIPVQHARTLAASHPGAIFHEFEGGHGWASSPDVDLARL